jgi:hypothetical protein
MMQLFQKVEPKICLNYEMQYKYCCKDLEEKHHSEGNLLTRKYRQDRMMGVSRPITADDLSYKFCPFCGAKIVSVIQYPSKDEIKRIIFEFLVECSYEDDEYYSISISPSQAPADDNDDEDD